MEQKKVLFYKSKTFASNFLVFGDIILKCFGAEIVKLQPNNTSISGPNNYMYKLKNNKGKMPVSS